MVPPLFVPLRMSDSFDFFESLHGGRARGRSQCNEKIVKLLIVVHATGDRLAIVQRNEKTAGI